MKVPARQFESIDEYICGFPKSVQDILERMRRTIREMAPGSAEAISYQMPTFELSGKNLVHFAGYEHHIGFYPLPSGIAAFEEQLAPYVQGKGSVQFPLDRPIPYELVGRIVAFRVQEILKGAGKKK